MSLIARAKIFTGTKGKILQHHQFQNKQMKETQFNEVLVTFTARAALFRLADGGFIISRKRRPLLQQEQCYEQEQKAPLMAAPVPLTPSKRDTF